MKKFICIAALTASLGAKADGRLKVTASIEGLPDGKMVFLYGLNTKLYDSTIVSNHGFTFDKTVKQGDVYIIQMDRDEQKGTVLYMETGDVTIKGKGPYFKDADYSGPAWIKEWQDLNAIMYDEKRFPGWKTLESDMNAAQQLGDQDKTKELMAKLNEYNWQRRDLGKTWVDQHPNSSVSAFVIDIFIRMYDSQDETRKYLDKLTPAAKSNSIATKLITVLNDDETTKIGKVAPAFTQPDVQGKTVSLADFKGKYVLVDFWASWCKPCRDQIPSLKALYEKYKGKNFTILSISMDTDKDKWMKALEQEKMPWIQVSDLQKENAAGKLYKVMAIPASFLVGPDGKIISYGSSEKILEEKLGH